MQCPLSSTSLLLACRPCTRVYCLQFAISYYYIIYPYYIFYFLIVFNNDWQVELIEGCFISTFQQGVTLLFTFIKLNEVPFYHFIPLLINYVNATSYFTVASHLIILKVVAQKNKQTRNQSINFAHYSIKVLTCCVSFLSYISNNE